MSSENFFSLDSSKDRSSKCGNAYVIKKYILSFVHVYKDI